MTDGSLCAAMLTEAPFEHLWITPASAKRIAGFDRRHDHFGRAEQQWIDGIEIPLNRLKISAKG